MKTTLTITAEVIEQLATVDSVMTDLLDKLEKIQFENDETDTLVSKLQDVISARQILIGQLVTDSQFEDRIYLQAQADKTTEFEHRAKKVLADREALLRGMRKGKRQTNLYKTIDSNR
ncbi:flagella biosynthesis chaperone for FliD, FliT [Shewanella kaireitica]|uniref:flagella biosynthesis chaperone for FliD, FliT n=1 Tax=Shewanella kaireitica TaxID=212021 RepID=UPI00200D880B|nr:flagella biosynthesis chaperone for FliD, FliT [Shewanella kaireitica]MCL1093753.1 flagella biosynthesis chaperone for FliD, FliT [Shewanella kaireitica]